MVCRAIGLDEIIYGERISRKVEKGYCLNPGAHRFSEIRDKRRNQKRKMRGVAIEKV